MASTSPMRQRGTENQYPLPPVPRDNPLRVLILTNRYLPGYRSGGPIRSLSHLVQQLAGQFEFHIITRDRDSGDTHSYPGIRVGEWCPLDTAQVMYLAPEQVSLDHIRRVIRSMPDGILYLNSAFCPGFSVFPLVLRRLALIPDRPTIVAPRGEFSPDALALKRSKKRFYLLAAQSAQLYRGVLWQASSEHEKKDIEREMGSSRSIAVAPDLPDPVSPVERLAVPREKTRGSLRLLFFSRLSRMKNLTGALAMLDGVCGDICFDIFGPIEDEAYWKECQAMISRLSPNIRVRYLGSVPHERAAECMGQYHILYLPSLGENFCHVILESLTNGCPVLISDRTPWRGLSERGVGWDLALDRPQEFRSVLQRCADMDAKEYEVWSRRATEYGIAYSLDGQWAQQSREMFHRAASMCAAR